MPSLVHTFSSDSDHDSDTADDEWMHVPTRSLTKEEGANRTSREDAYANAAREDAYAKAKDEGCPKNEDCSEIAQGDAAGDVMSGANGTSKGAAEPSARVITEAGGSDNAAAMMAAGVAAGAQVSANVESPTDAVNSTMVAARTRCVHTEDAAGAAGRAAGAALLAVGRDKAVVAVPVVSACAKNAGGSVVAQGVAAGTVDYDAGGTPEEAAEAAPRVVKEAGGSGSSVMAQGVAAGTVLSVANGPTDVAAVCAARALKAVGGGSDKDTALATARTACAAGAAQGGSLIDVANAAEAAACSQGYSNVTAEAGARAAVLAVVVNKDGAARMASRGRRGDASLAADEARVTAECTENAAGGSAVAPPGAAAGTVVPAASFTTEKVTEAAVRAVIAAGGSDNDAAMEAGPAAGTAVTTKRGSPTDVANAALPAALVGVARGDLDNGVRQLVFKVTFRGGGPCPSCKLHPCGCVSDKRINLDGGGQWGAAAGDGVDIIGYGSGGSSDSGGSSGAQTGSMLVAPQSGMGSQVARFNQTIADPNSAHLPLTPEVHRDVLLVKILAGLGWTVMGGCLRDVHRRLLLRREGVRA